MKTLLFITTLLASLPAYAEAWFIENNSNGQIIITDKVCSLKGKEYNALKQGYARSADGMTIYGCWFYENKLVHMTYNNGDVYTYAAGDFKKLGTQ